MAQAKIPNIAIIGCSSAGKSTIVRLLAEQSGGVIVSLDAKNADGRSIISVAPVNPKEFMEGDPIREKMMQEAKDYIEEDHVDGEDSQEAHLEKALASELILEEI